MEQLVNELTPEMLRKKSLESKKQGIVDTLKEGLVHLQFKKVNGDLRNMIGTLSSEHIPEDKVPEEGKERKSNEELVVLFDTEVNDWRSFRTENLVEYRSA
jgi:hypothetical protein